jgi:hypothetical protein
MNKYFILFASIIGCSQLALAKTGSKTVKAEIRVTDVQCLKEGAKVRGHLATAQIKTALEGTLGSEVKIFFDKNRKDLGTFLKGDEAIVTLHKGAKYWVLTSPADRKSIVASAGMAPVCQ